MKSLTKKEILLNRPPLKQLIDAAATAKVVIKGDIYEKRPLGLRERLNCVKFYFDAAGVHRLHAMLPRTGSHWSELGLALSINLAQGGDGEYTFIGDLYVPTDGIHLRRLDWRVPMGRTEEMYLTKLGPGTVGVHNYYHSRHPYFRIRSGALKRMKIVVLTRSIVVSMAARFLKHLRDPDDLSHIRDSEDVMDWKFFLDQSVEFYNSWGDVLTWHPNICLYRYEDLRDDPVAGHKEILDFWGFDVPEECIAEAFRRITPEEMLKRIPAEKRDANYRVATPVGDPEQFMPPHRKREIIDRIKRDLVYDFGYEYDYDTEYDLSSL